MATPRDPSAPTDGWAGAFVAATQGRPWIPWQRYVADVMGERTPTGRYRYWVVVVTVPRQCGKTTFAFDVALGRALLAPDYRVAYTAQTGSDAGKRFIDRFRDIAGGPLRTRLQMKRSMGRETITVTHAGPESYVQAFAPPPASTLRGSALDLVVIDEAQELGTAAGQQLDAESVPTFQTRPRRQLLIIGTAGTDTSDYLRRHLGDARDRAPGHAVFEWGLLEGDDADDEQVWPLRHPGLDQLPGTDLDTLRTARAVMGPAGFAREYGNRWSRTSTRTFDPADWAACQTPDTDPPSGPGLAFGLEVAADRSAATIAAATDTTLEIVDRRPGTDWLVARALELQAAHRAPFAVDRFGASGPFVDALEVAGADLLLMRTGDTANAAAGFVDDIASRTLRVVPSASLSAAVDGAARRVLADTGGFVWSRTASVAPIDPLIAASHALWGAKHRPPDVKPAVFAL